MGYLTFTDEDYAQAEIEINKQRKEKLLKQKNCKHEWQLNRTLSKDWFYGSFTDCVCTCCKCGLNREFLLSTVELTQKMRK